jgi:hypothetical protein
MPQEKKLRKKTKKVRKTKVILMPADDIPPDDSDEEESEIADEDEGGIYLEKEDVQIIFNALHDYKPTAKEEQLHSMLVEQFEEILVVDYDEPMPDVN